MNPLPTDQDVFASTIAIHAPLPGAEDPGADAWRALRTGLLHGSSGDTLRSVLVTSADAGEGKSLTCSRLARSIAALGRRVLVVDADLRLPTQHDHFGIAAPDAGLGTNAGSLDSCCLPVAERVDLLPAGRPAYGSTELLSRPALRNELARLMSGYDFAIVDTPPVGRVPDAAILAELTSGVVFVVDARRQHAQLARRALRSLQQVDANVLGAVLNRYDLGGPGWNGNQYGYGMS